MSETARGPASVPEPPAEPEVLVITGMSGAGRSTTANVLEDIGWFVVDNLPPQMLRPLAELSTRARGTVDRVAAVVDVRGRSFFTDVRETISELERFGIRARVLFLDADDAVLVRRFEQVRRPHPLQGDERILDGIDREREILGDLRGAADVVFDTSALNVHELSAKVHQVFGLGGEPVVRVTLLSFGFKYGIPLDADHVADVRFLPNPFWVPELRPQNGLDPQVSRYVLSRPGALEFMERYAHALEPVLTGYIQEDKRYATIAVGCTGGKHRSVAIVEDLAGRLAGPGVTTRALHRDLGRE